MTLPGFTANLSSYNTTNHYSDSVSKPMITESFIMPAAPCCVCEREGPDNIIICRGRCCEGIVE